MAFIQIQRFLILLFLFTSIFVGCGKSGVRGKVMVNHSPVAAGTITFRLRNKSNEKLVGVISNGKYKIESKIIPGDYDVKIDIHFANASEAEDFYANMSKELNKEKILHGDTPELVQNENEDGEEKPKIESPLKSYEYQSYLTSGSNVHDFNIDR